MFQQQSLTGHPHNNLRTHRDQYRRWTVPVCQMYWGLVSTAVCASISQMERKSSATLQREGSGAPLETPSVPTALQASSMATAPQLLYFPTQPRRKKKKPKARTEGEERDRSALSTAVRPRRSNPRRAGLRAPLVLLVLAAPLSLCLDP